MSRILLTADWHLTDNPRDEYRHQWQAELRRLVTKHEVSVVLLLGDICEEKDRHPASLVNRVVGHLDQLADHCKVTILMGNHDYAQVGSPFWAFLNAVPHLNFCSQIEDWPELDGVLFLPHTRNWQKDWEHIDLKKYKLVFAHNTFEGADAGHGHKLSGIPTKIFAPDAKVYAGDIHVPQTLGPVTYVGSPYTINFGDAYSPRVVLLEGSKVTDIPCKGPQKMVVWFEYDGDVKLVTKAINLVPGDIVQARVYIHRQDYAKWQEIVEKIQKWGEEEGVNVFQVRPEIEDGGPRTLASKTTGKVNKRSDKEVFEAYAKRMSIDKDTVKAGEKLL